MNILTNPNKLRGFERHIKVENVSRRSVLKGLGLAGGFVLAAPVMSRPGFAAYQTGADKMPHGTVVDPRVFVSIASDGTVTILAHRAEMGTGVRTSLPMIVLSPRTSSPMPTPRVSASGLWRSTGPSSRGRGIDGGRSAIR